MIAYDYDAFDTHVMYILCAIDKKISPWRHAQMTICKAAGFSLHLAEI